VIADVEVSEDLLEESTQSLKSEELSEDVDEDFEEHDVKGAVVSQSEKLVAVIFFVLLGFWSFFDNKFSIRNAEAFSESIIFVDRLKWKKDGMFNTMT